MGRICSFMLQIFIEPLQYVRYSVRYWRQNDSMTESVPHGPNNLMSIWMKSVSNFCYIRVEKSSLGYKAVYFRMYGKRYIELFKVMPHGEKHLIPLCSSKNHN